MLASQHHTSAKLFVSPRTDRRHLTVPHGERSGPLTPLDEGELVHGLQKSPSSVGRQPTNVHFQLLLPSSAVLLQ